MRVLIVDDDLPTTEVIRSTIRWDSLGIDSVCTAFNFNGAKKRMLESPAEIVLCDIEMPDGTGIDLLKWINENGINSKVVFLTCHSSFYYAAAAIEEHAFGYITKPFVQIEVEAILAKAVNSMLTEQKLDTIRKETLKQEFWRRLVFQELDADPENLLRILAEEYPGVSVPESIRPLLASVPATYTKASWNDDVFIVAFRNLVSSVAAEFSSEIQVVAYIRNDCNYCFMAAPSSMQFTVIRRLLEKIMSTCKQQLGFTPSSYADRVVPLSLLPDSRRKIQDFDCRNIIGKGKFFPSIPENGESSDLKISMDSDEILSLMRNWKLHDVISTIGDFLGKMYSSKALSAELLNSVRSDYQQVLYSFLLENGIKANELFKDLKQIEKSSGTSMVDFIKWVTISAEKAIDAVKNRQKYSETTRRMVIFIKDHCSENPALKDIAECACLSSDYASRIFKSDTGMSVKEYLNKARIEKAMRLLRNGQDNISGVAYETGFENSSYFSTIFKQVTGLSPTQFLKQRDDE